MYEFKQLDPRPAADNSAVFINGTEVLGIEVTIPELSEKCSLGNVDPQHQVREDTAVAMLTAIEAAIAWPLPPEEATLATVRTDADSVGAMAVFFLRAGGETLSNDALRRIAVIAEHDRANSAAWTRNDADQDAGTIEALVGLAANFKVPLGLRVRSFAKWLATGEFDERAKEAATAASNAKAAQAASVASGETTVSLHNDIAVVRSPHAWATGLGYRHAPFVVATNETFRFSGGEPHRKHTLCVFPGEESPPLNGELVQRLNAAEIERGLSVEAALWGGSVKIVGSPQGIPSRLESEEVAEILSEFLGLTQNKN